MDRREFLWVMGGTMMLPEIAAAQTAARATVLYDGRAIVLNRATVDGDALWIQKAELPSINGFELKPQGACREEICIPIPRPMMNGTRFNLSAFAQRVGQRVVADPAMRVWSFGEIPVVRGAFLESRQSPDFSVPDRKGRLVRLSQFRGKKVLVVTWASW
jgi:hypothetical protein